MTRILCRTGQFRRVLCVTLAVATFAAPSVSAVAQTNAAAMAVRKTAEGLSPGGPESPQPQGTPAAGPGQTVPTGSSSGKIDTRYIAPAASVVIVVRPSQILASPFAQIFPVEVVSAGAMKHVGFDATEMEEVINFVDMSNPISPAGGTTFKFKNPIRATSIPLEMRKHAQLAELAGKKYLRSAVPTEPSLYGPNNKTLIAATDLALRQMVENVSQPKSGPLLDRVHEVQAGSDLYVAVDLAMVKPFVPMILAQAQAMGKTPPEAKQFLDMLPLVSAVELTLNVSAPGPTSVVIHCADDAAAQKVEAALQEWLQKQRSSKQTEQPAGDDPLAQAMERYYERVYQPFQPQRSGNSVTWVHFDGQNPAQQQLVNAGIIRFVVTTVLPAIQSARGGVMRAQAAPGGPPSGPVAPGSPEAGPQR